MTETPQQQPSDRLSWLTRLAGHRAIAGIFVLFAVVGALMGYSLLAEDMSVFRRVLGGAMSGVGIALLITATKAIG
jgi:hypothetical protein